MTLVEINLKMYFQTILILLLKICRWGLSDTSLNLEDKYRLIFSRMILYLPITKCYLIFK
jgi:hypothetical protein